MNQGIEVELHLKKIDDIIWENHEFNSDNQGLVNGELGLVFYAYNLYKYTKEEVYLERAFEVLGEIFESINNEKSHLTKNGTLADGLAGFGWVLTQLIKDDLLDPEYNDYLDGFDDILIATAEQFIKASMFDFLYGAFGIIYYLLHRPQVNNTEKFNHLLTLVIQGAIKDEQGIRFYNKDNSKYTNGIVTGLSHGMSGYLLVMMECYKKDIMKSELKEIVIGCLDYIIRHSQVEDSGDHSCFPLRINESEEDLVKHGVKVEYGKRLAWCNGDLDVLWTLYKAAETFELPSYKTLADKAMNRCCARLSFDSARIQDAHFCHGASGVSFFYGALFSLTQQGNFEDARDFWMKETLQYLSNKTYDEKNLSLIDGLPGINLVLAADYYKFAEWQDIFLLN